MKGNVSGEVTQEALSEDRSHQVVIQKEAETAELVVHEGGLGNPIYTDSEPNETTTETVAGEEVPAYEFWIPGEVITGDTLDHQLEILNKRPASRFERLKSTVRGWLK